ncbi:MAG TPA: hypothetical protein EYN66_19615, partial [Myxococcales bacterium]|nr:hypothetical protein [Myxococcales bacterium]
MLIMGLKKTFRNSGATSMARSLSCVLLLSGWILACEAEPETHAVNCETGTFAPVNADACQPCSDPCTPGSTETAACTATSNRLCTPCEAGFFDDDQAPLTECVGCSDPCTPGSTETVACTATSNRLCTPCEAGFFDDDQA